MGSEFMAALRDIVPNPCLDRPFVCDGNPLNCQMMIVGENPATPLSTNWWSLWRADEFDLRKFNLVYEERRKGSHPSRTRSRVDAFLTPFRARQIGCVDTNADRNELAGGSKRIAPNDDVLELLLRLPKLKVVVAHGKLAKESLRGKIPHGVNYFETRHFSREATAVIANCRGEVERALGL